MKINEIMCRSALVKSALPEADFVLNPYVGCSHSCNYCYASFMRRFTGHIAEKWGSFVDVRMNSPEVLSRELKRNRVGSLLLGSVTDCYMPIEAQYKLTRRCLEAIAANQGGISVSVLTKSALVTRDIDLFQKTNASVGITITSHKDEISRDFENFASSISSRLAALRQLHSSGIKTYVFVGPILPDLTNLEEILKNVKDYVDSVMGETLNFRGCFSECKMIYENRYPDSLPVYLAAKKDYRKFAEETRKRFLALCEFYSIKVTGFYTHLRNNEVQKNKK